MKTRKNISREKTRKSLFNSESAGATVVAAVLLLSIIFTVLAVVRTEYVPMWKNDAEQSHMGEVHKDMAELKSTADMISLFTPSDSNTSEYGFPVTVSFSMGGGEIPILEPSKSSGTLSLNTERCRMIITPQRSSISNSTKIVDCGGVTYYSNNREYLDQVLRYENGALILSQKDRSLMRQSPSFKIKRTIGDNYTVSIHAIKMTGNPDSISSNTDASLRLTGLYTEPVYDSNDSEEIDSFTCTILTEYPDAWVSHLNETAKNADLEYGTDYDLYKVSSDTVSFSCLNNGTKNLERLYVSKSVIQAELVDGISVDSEVNGSESGEDKSVMELEKWYFFDTFTGTYDGAPISTSPDLLKDFDSNIVFPPGNYKGSQLTSYSSNNSLSQEVARNKNLVMNFNFTSFEEFNNTPSSATIRMIYRYGREDRRPDMDMWFTGENSDSFNPQDNWRLYNSTFTVSPLTPSDLNFNMEIDADNREQGTFYIDYLAVYLS